MTKVVFNNFYLTNKLDHNIILKAGYIRVPNGGFAKVLESDLEHPDVQDAINRGWVEVHSAQPDPSDLRTPIAPVIENDQYRGMTAAELQTSEAPAKKSTAGSETIGRNTDKVEKTAEASSVQIGQSAEEANGAKKSRKAADKATSETPAAD
jgi:hypothetical protein